MRLLKILLVLTTTSLAACGGDLANPDAGKPRPDASHGTCGSTSCSGGQVCNPYTVTCCMPKCDGRQCGSNGWGGVCGYCASGSTCDDSTGQCAAPDPCKGKTCAGDTPSCDPTSGGCVCTTSPDSCTGGKVCDPTTKACQVDACAGVACAITGEACDPTDGKCHCNATSPACPSGWTCDASRKCMPPTDPCQGKTCADPTLPTCDKQSGVCTCNSSPDSCGTGMTCLNGACAADLCPAGNCSGRSPYCNPGSGACECTASSCDIGSICDPATKQCQLAAGADAGVPGPDASFPGADAGTADSGPPWTPPAASSFGEISSFGSNPGGLKMYLYVPANLPANAPVVVALHGCTQTAQTYMMTTGWDTLADTYKFYVVYPEQQKKNTDPSSTDRTGNPYQCFNWAGYYGYEFARGQGENQSIIEMIDYLRNDQPKKGYSVDPKRIFITGLSAGAAMSVAMAAFWPDVFAGAAPMAGVPFYCANAGNQPGNSVQSAAYDCMGITSSFTPRTPAAGDNCASGTACIAAARKHDGATWGGYVRAQGPAGYSGPYPRIFVWQGSKDQYVDPNDMGEIVKQWTNIHGISETPASSPTVLKAGNTKHAYAEYRRDGDATPLVATVSLTSMTHGIAVDPTNKGVDGGGQVGSYSWDWGIYSSYYAAVFWGITSAPPPAGTPTVKFTAPQDGATVKGKVTVSADATPASGATISSVAFFLDSDATPLSTVNASSYSFDWNSDTVTQDGAHTLKAVATDDQGRTGSASISITLRTAPAASCVLAANTAHVTAGRAHTCPDPYSPTTTDACATGSDDNLGMDSDYVFTYLQQSTPGTWTKTFYCTP